ESVPPAACGLILTDEVIWLEHCLPAEQPGRFCSVRLDRVTDVSSAVSLPCTAQALQTDSSLFYTSSGASEDLGFNPPGAADEGSDRLLNETSTRVVDEVSTASSEPGSFLGEMPPIPFGLLPMTRPALPTRWQAPTNVKSGKLPDRPIADYD
ncbi:unnamed protein product, partial [Polarella glacialis]